MTTDTLVTLPSDREIAMTRVFDAPASLVWRAFTSPELVSRWLLGPDGWTMPICEIDLQVGGKWRYGWAPAEPGEHEPFEMHGEYQEIEPYSRIVHTEIYQDGAPAIVTTTFTEEDGRTTMTTTMLLDSKETRDIVIGTGMSDGAGRSYDRLAELLPTFS